MYTYMLGKKRMAPWGPLENHEEMLLSRRYVLLLPSSGAGERFLPRGGPILKKPFFCDFSKNLLNKSQILGGVRPPRTPPVPPPLFMRTQFGNSFIILWKIKILSTTQSLKLVKMSLEEKKIVKIYSGKTYFFIFYF